MEDAENANQNARITAIADYNQDVTAILHDFYAAAASMAMATANGIEAAWGTYELAHNAAVETFRNSANDAVREYDQDVAAHVEDFRQQEATQWRQYQVSAAGAYQTWLNDTTAAIVERSDDGAAAALTAEQAANAALNAREQTMASLATYYRANVTGAYLTYATNVSNQIAADYSLAFGGAPAETAVANGYRDHAVDTVTAWGDALVGEALAFQAYANSESAQRQASNDILATANRDRISGDPGDPASVGITDAFSTFLGSVATEAPEHKGVSRNTKVSGTVSGRS